MLIKIDNSCTLPFFPYARQSICMYLWVSLFLAHSEVGWNLGERHVPSINSTSFCEGMRDSGTAWWQNTFPAPISLSQGE